MLQISGLQKTAIKFLNDFIVSRQIREFEVCPKFLKEHLRGKQINQPIYFLNELVLMLF